MLRNGLAGKPSRRPRWHRGGDSSLRRRKCFPIAPVGRSRISLGSAAGGDLTKTSWQLHEALMLWACCDAVAKDSQGLHERFTKISWSAKVLWRICEEDAKLSRNFHPSLRGPRGVFLKASYEVLGAFFWEAFVKKWQTPNIVELSMLFWGNPTER